MRGIKHLLGSLAVAGMMLASTVQVSVAAKAQGNGGSGGSGGAGLCKVDIIRNAAPGVFDITRATLRDGGCVCILKTGPKDQDAGVESAVTTLLDRRTCPTAALAPDGAYGGGLGTGVIIGGIIVLGGGLGAALATGGSKSP